MPQKTNLNISPYYDDFNPQDNFYRVLFKPGFPVQARELTNLQSILQNQIESFGSHIFQEGSMVIPGAVTFDNRYFSVKINPDHLGIDVTVYLQSLVDTGVRLKGQSSGVVATIKGFTLPPNEGVTDITIYVKYLDSGDDFKISQFSDGEILVLLDNATYGNTTLNAGDTVLTVLSQNATAVGSAVGVDRGVYFIRGTFVNVPMSNIVLDPYSNTPTYRVGLNILEEIITSNDESQLNDNARGFSNYAAPGADRLKISTTLVKKAIDDYQDTNFVELLKVDAGVVKSVQNTSDYSLIRDYFAQRTYEETGNFALNSFNVDVLNSLNDEVSSNGIYIDTQKTEQGNIPSDDLMCVRVSAGKAYVKGYDVSLPGSRVVDVKKPRDTKTISEALVPFEMGNLLRVNNVYGTPLLGLNSSNTISLYSKRRNTSNTTSGTGTLIGKARAYTFQVTDAAYTDQTTSWDLYLFDIQTYTALTLSSSLGASDVPVSSYVRGLSSGATGYVAVAPNSTLLYIDQTSGNFLSGEQIIFNENTQFSRTVKSITVYNTDDIKSVFQNSPALDANLQSCFIADTVLYRSIPTGFNASDQITITSGGTVTCPVSIPAKSFLTIKPGSIIRYQKQGSNVETFNVVSSVSADGLSMTLSALDSSVSKICDGTLPGTTISTPFALGVPTVLNTDKASLYSQLPKANISALNLGVSNLIVTSQVKNKSVNGSGSLTITTNDVGITSSFFEAFNPQRYSIFYSNGTIEPLSSDQFTLGPNAGSITLSGLTASATGVSVNVTLAKNLTSTKAKNFVRSNQLAVTYTSGVSDPAISGLSTNSYYGLRVEDRDISLNVPDVVNVVAIYQSVDTNAPVLDSLTFPTGLALNTKTIVGEKIVGQNSRAVAQLVTQISSNQIGFVYLNSKQFTAGETVIFKESNIQTNIQSVNVGSYTDLTSNYTLDKGQKDQFYDYSKIVRKAGSILPSKQLLIIYDCYQITTNNNGDVSTVNSYTKDRFSKDIPLLQNGSLRATDTLDFRPAVSNFTSNTSSPFDFSSRSFSSSINYVITPNEGSLLGYSYYLPRVDKVTLTKFGQVSVIVGNSDDSPKPPVNVDDSMDVADIYLPPYLYSPTTDVKFKLYDNRRYTMRDIGALDNRIKNLETVTTLNLLELDTKSLQIQDADGINRFKTGFVADNFKNSDLISTTNTDNRCDVDVVVGELSNAVDFWSIAPQLAYDPSVNLSQNISEASGTFPLLDPNTTKTGDLITLNYTEVEWITQPQASDVENVNPFNVIAYVGGVILDPASDNWIRTIYVDNSRTESTGAQWVQSSNTTTDTFTQGNQNVTRKTTTYTNTLEGPSREFNYVESIKVSGQIDPYMRSRNVYFAASGLKPFTQHYYYMDNISGLDIVPKLVEISMISGTFQVGETVGGFFGGQQILRALVKEPNHKKGLPDGTTKLYNINPYDRNLTLGSTYSPTSTVLNIGVNALASDMEHFQGLVTPGMTLSGQTSGAVATVTNVRLITDNYGDLIGAFFIRDPNTNPPIKINSGQRTFKLTAAPPGITPLPGSTTYASNASTTYSGSGTILTQNTTTVNVRNPPPPPDKAPTVTETRVDIPKPPPPSNNGGDHDKDPLAQTFKVDETGAFLTGVDVYFGNKDPNQRLFVEVRTVELGTPTTQLVQDYARAVLDPNDIQISSDASVPTHIKFPSPIYLESAKTYALVFLAPTSDMFEMWVATMGQPTVQTANLPDVQNVIISKQYNGGSLFKSQNGEIWTPSQYQDLTFKLYKAKFVSSGDAVFYNTRVAAGNINVPNLQANAIRTYPRKLKVPVQNVSAAWSKLVPGTKVGQGSINQTGITGIIEKIGGSINAVGITTGGNGFIPSQVYSNVPLYSISGLGQNATATVTTSASGTVQTVSIANTGTGYVVGDSLGITTSAVVKGYGAVLSVSSVYGTDTLYLTNVQGDSFNLNQPLVYYNGNTRVSSGTTISADSSLISSLYSGNVFKVQQYNHGMHGANNLVNVTNVAPDTAAVALTGNLGINDTQVSVATTIPFGNFEGVSTSRGYAIVDSEIVQYTGLSNNILQLGARGVNGSPITPHASGSVIYPYQINGVSLTRINTTFTLPTDPALSGAVDLDSYYLQFNRTDTPQVSFTDQKSVGENNIQVSQNHQFSTIVPQFNVITPGNGTQISAQIRTISGTSSGGSEVSFVDQGYEAVNLNSETFLKTPRLVASEINENAYLANLPLNKSLALRTRMQSIDPNLSPVIDTKNAIFILGRNRLNNPIVDYVTDDRSNRTSGDPHSSVYITKKVDLAQAATSLQVIVSACRPAEADFRVLYQLFKSDSSEITQSYVLFPGYDNLTDTTGNGYGNRVIDPSKNTGRADAFVRASNDNEFLDYQFTAHDLDPFSGFIIKVVMSSTNESARVRLKDFRAIALA